MTPEQVRIVTFDVAAYLHGSRHRSQKTVFCTSDLKLAEHIIELVTQSEEKFREDDQR